jgi:hypothetical protein
MALPLAEHLSPELETSLDLDPLMPSLCPPPAIIGSVADREDARSTSWYTSVHATPSAKLPTSPWPYAVTAIAAARTQHKRLWLAACQLVSSKARSGWMAAFADFSLSGTRETILS